MSNQLEQLLRDELQEKHKAPKTSSEQVLQMIKESGSMKKEKTNIRKSATKVAVAILAVGLAGGGVTYAANTLLDGGVAKLLGISKDVETKGRLEQEGFVTDSSLSATDGGITLTLANVVADEKCLKVFMDVSVDDRYKNFTMTKKNWSEKYQKWIYFPNISFVGDEFSNEDAFRFTNANVSYFDSGAEAEGENKVYFEGSFMGDFSEDSVLDINFKELYLECEDGSVLTVHGEWNFSTNVSVGTTTGVYEINQTIPVGDYKLEVERLEVTPLRSKLYFKSTQDWMELNRLEGKVELDPKTGDLKCDENGEYEILSMRNYDENANKKPDYDTMKYAYIPLATAPMYYLDGESIMQSMGEGGQMEGNSRVVDTQWDRPISKLGQLEKIVIAGKCIDLTKCEYSEKVAK